MVHSLLSNSRHHETQNATQPAGFHCLEWRRWTKLVESDEGLKHNTLPKAHNQLTFTMLEESDEGVKHNVLPKAHNQLTFTMLVESDEGVKHNVLPKAHNQLTVSGKDQTNE